MSLAPRAVMVTRPSEYDELLARHGTPGQAAFFLSTRGRDLGEVEARHRQQQAALEQVSAAIPLDWRQGSVERDDLDRFLFGPEDVVVVVGQDGLVANVAKYLDGQPVIGVNPDPARNPGVLVRHAPEDVMALLRRTFQFEERTMVEALTDDDQALVALNEVFVGPRTHQTARYTVRLPEGSAERQASSGVIVATGTGSTGWCRSLWVERQSVLDLPGPTAQALAWFIREAWPSPATGTSLTEGLLDEGELRLTIESDGLVVFGDGIESDHLTVSWGQTVTVRRSRRVLHLVG